MRFFISTGDYCDVYLTHDSMSVRKAHNAGRNHLRNVVEYYQRAQSLPLFSSLSFLISSCLLMLIPAEIGHEKAQSVIDSITSSYAAEGQANPMLQQPQHPGAPGSFPPPPSSFGLPGMYRLVSSLALSPQTRGVRWLGKGLQD